MVGFFLVHPVPKGYFSWDLVLQKMVPGPVFPQDSPCPQDHVHLPISPGVYKEPSVLNSPPWLPAPAFSMLWEESVSFSAGTPFLSKDALSIL